MDTEFKEILKKYRNKRIVFWGASLFLKNFLFQNKLDDFDIAGIVDLDVRKLGTEFCGYKIINYRNLANLGEICVISAVANSSSSVYKQISKMIDLLAKSSKITLAENPFYSIELKKLASNHIYLINDRNEKFEVSYIPGLTIKWGGENSTVIFYTNDLPNIENTVFKIKSDSSIKIGFNIICGNLLINMPRSKCSVEIGDNCNFPKSVELFTGRAEGRSIKIGDNCLFAENVYFRCTDGHTVYDNESNEILNNSGDIVVGNHVWFGREALVLKNAQIADDTVVGARSIVNKKITESNCLIAGIPAKIVKRGINWSIRDIEKFEDGYYSPKVTGLEI